jgi:hypothetical protein
MLISGGTYSLRVGRTSAEEGFAMVFQVSSAAVRGGLR